MIWKRLALLLLLGACSKPQVPLLRLDALHLLGEPVAVNNLTVWPVLAEGVEEVGEYLTLQEAQADDVVVVRERESATVGSITIENHGEVPILVSAGTIIAGGKQDRQIGEDLVVAAGAEVSARSFCVERSRWSAYPGDELFVASKYVADAGTRRSGQYEQSQAAVWDRVEVAQLAQSGDAATDFRPPPVSFHAVVEGAEEDVRERWRGTVRSVLAHLAGQKRVDRALVGYAYAVDGQVAGLRTFAHPGLLEPRLEAFVQSMCFDAEWGIEYSNERRFRVEWREVMELIETTALPHTSPFEPGPETTLEFYDVKGLVSPDEAVRALQDFDADVEVKNSVLVVTARPEEHEKIRRSLADLPRPPVPPASSAAVVALFRSLEVGVDEAKRTSGTNRNAYDKTDEGYHSACYVRRAGTWVALTRDWIAR